MVTNGLEKMANLLKNQKIACISDQQYPIEKADSEQVVNTVSALTSKGINIRLVIPRDWKTVGIPKQERLQTLRNFYNLKNGLYSKELLNLPLTKLRAEKYTHGILAPIWAKLNGYRIIYTRNFLPAFISNWLGLKVVFESYRFFENSNRLLGRLLRRLSKSGNFLGIITHSGISQNSLAKFGIDVDKIKVIHNGFNPVLFREEITKDQARRQLNLMAYEKIACYTGRLDREKGIESLLTLAAKTPEITYLFIGKSQQDPEGWITQIASKRGLENVKSLPWMTADKVATYLFAADVLLIPPTTAPLTQYGKTVLPIKLFSYLAAGRTILAPKLADTEDILNSQNAVLVEPDDPANAENAIRKIFSNVDWANKIANKAKRDAQLLTWEARATKIISFINERLNNNG